MWDSTGPREPGEVFHLSRTTTFRWLAEDIKGNVSRGSEQFVITPQVEQMRRRPGARRGASSPRRAS